MVTQEGHRGEWSALKPEHAVAGCCLSGCPSSVHAAVLTALACCSARAQHPLTGAAEMSGHSDT
jgi:hypothetical protein